MSMLLSSEKPFVEFMNKWAAEYWNMTVADDFEFFTRAADIYPSRPLTRKNIRILEKWLEGQLLFMKYYATTRMILTATKANFINTKRFLNQQSYWKKAAKKAEYGVFFTLINGSRVFLFTDNLKDIDFADIYAGTGFYDIYITCSSRKKVQPGFPRTFLKRLRWDLKYDYQGVELSEPYVDKQETEPRTFHVTCSIEGNLGIDKTLKIMKCNDLFKVDVLKWILS